MTSELHRLLDNLIDPAWLIDSGGAVVYANAPAQAFPPYPPVHPRDSARLETGWQQLGRAKTPLVLTLRLGETAKYRRYRCLLAPLSKHRLLLGHEAEGRLEQLTERLPLGIGFLDRELRFERVNPALSRLAGLPPAACLEHSLEEVLGPKATPLIELCQATLENARAQEDELRWKERGSPRLWWVEAYPLQDENETWGVALTLRELGNPAEEAADLSEHYRNLVTQVREYAIFGTNPEGFIRTWNEGCERVLGYDRQSFLGMDFRELFTPEDRAVGVPEAELRQALTEGSAGDDRWMLRKGGERFWASGVLNLLRDERGDLLGFTKVMRDLTQERQAEERLRHSEEQLRRIVEGAPFPIILEAEDGEVLQLSQAWTELTGYSITELKTAEAWLKRVHSPEAEALREGLRGLFEGRLEVVETEFDLVTWSGDVRTWAMSATSLGNLPDGRRLVVGMAVDLTERKRAEAALRESEERYREISEIQKRFVNDAAHELRAPLTAIQGNLELLTRFKHMSREDREAALAEASREAARLSRLVSNLLALARGDAGRELRLKPVALDKVLLETIEAKRRLSREHRLELGRLDSVWVQGDPEQLRHLLLILLDNAVKYTPPGGMILLELSSEGEQAVLHLQDSGVGVAPEDLPHVFERFYRADVSRSPRSGGTGLGLSVAQWIVEQHSGTIRLESQLGVGTSVTVALPLYSTKLEHKL